MHLICTECGSGEELALDELAQTLDAAAAARSFVPQRHIVVLQGRCGKCARSAPPAWDRAADLAALVNRQARPKQGFDLTC